jgi:hypothetical protein
VVLGRVGTLARVNATTPPIALRGAIPRGAAWTYVEVTSDATGSLGLGDERVEVATGRSVVRLRWPTPARVLPLHASAPVRIGMVAIVASRAAP